MESESNDVVIQLSDVRKGFYRALVDKDASFMKEHLHKDFFFTRADAVVQSLGQFIDYFVLNTELVLDNLRHHQESFQIFDNTAVISCQLSVQAVAGGVLMSLHERFTEVYVKDNGSWKLVTIHTCFVPEDIQK